ncbi:MAG: hypothetical protein VW239_04150 [Candidatus Nanopelagicales bacterium]
MSLPAVESGARTETPAGREVCALMVFPSREIVALSRDQYERWRAVMILQHKGWYGTDRPGHRVTQPGKAHRRRLWARLERAYAVHALQEKLQAELRDEDGVVGTTVGRVCWLGGTRDTSA